MKKLFKRNLLFAAGFAFLNVIMYFAIKKFWIGGSSFLPMIGIIGKSGAPTAFLFAFIVNIGVIFGSLISSLINKEFNFKLPSKNNILKSIFGGILIGIGVTLAPGTCTTSFVTGMPMLSISSFLSVAGIFIGAYITYSIVKSNKRGV